MAWSTTEVRNGVFIVSNDDVEITVNRDFSGEITTAAGDYIMFEDLRVLIDGAKLLEQELSDRYGGYK